MLHQFHNALLASTGYVTPKVSGSDHWSDGYYEIPLCSHMFWIPDHFPEFSLLLRPSAVRNWRMRLEMTFQNEFQLHHNVTVWERAGKLRKGSEIKQTQSDQSLQRGSFHQYQRPSNMHWTHTWDSFAKYVFFKITKLMIKSSTFQHINSFMYMHFIYCHYIMYLLTIYWWPLYYRSEQK